MIKNIFVQIKIQSISYAFIWASSVRLFLFFLSLFLLKIQCSMTAHLKNNNFSQHTKKSRQVIFHLSLMMHRCNWFFIEYKRNFSLIFFFRVVIFRVWLSFYYYYLFLFCRHYFVFLHETFIFLLVKWKRRVSERKKK